MDDLRELHKCGSGTLINQMNDIITKGESFKIYVTQYKSRKVIDVIGMAKVHGYSLVGRQPAVKKDFGTLQAYDIYEKVI